MLLHSFSSSFSRFNSSKQNEREIHRTTHANATHVLSTRPTQSHDTVGAPTTNLLTLSPRWLPLVVIFAVSRETLFGMNLSIISAMSGIVDPCALLENDDSAGIQRCSGDHTMVQYELLCLQSTSNASFPPNDVILFALHLSSSSSFSSLLIHQSRTIHVHHHQRCRSSCCHHRHSRHAQHSVTSLQHSW